MLDGTPGTVNTGYYLGGNRRRVRAEGLQHGFELQTAFNDTTTTEATIDQEDLRRCSNEADGTIRTEVACEVFADDGLFGFHLLIDAGGAEQVAAAIGELRDQMPGHSLTRTTVVHAHHDHARFGWQLAPNAPRAPSPSRGRHQLPFWRRWS